MKAAFYKAKGTIVDRLIKWWTKGNYYGDGYHVFGYYSKNKCVDCLITKWYNSGIE